MKIVKYNETTNTYTNPFEVDIPSLLSDDWDYLAECPSCHKRVKWGEMINCGDYYTAGGLWIIPICPECAQKYWDRKIKENKNEKRNVLHTNC